MANVKLLLSNCLKHQYDRCNILKHNVPVYKCKIKHRKGFTLDELPRYNLALP